MVRDTESVKEEVEEELSWASEERGLLSAARRWAPQGLLITLPKHKTTSPLSATHPTA